MDKPPQPQRNGRRASSVSLSPRKTRKALNPSALLPVRRKTKIRYGVALSKNETVLVTGAGDVLVSRCRFSSKAYSKLKQADGNSEQGNDHSHELFWWEAADCQSVCVNPCSGSDSGRLKPRGGLLGGSPPCSGSDSGGLLGGSPPQFDTVQVDSRVENERNELTSNSADSPEKDDEASNASRPAEETKEGDRYDSIQIPASKTSGSLQAVSTDDGDEMDNLEGIPSFDYSHFAGEGNDMAPTPTNELAVIQEEEQKVQEKRQVEVEYRAEPPVLMHGIPTFLPAFHQIKITQVSANPLGSHVLLISEEALLFSFGLNNHGQLGHGYKSPEKGSCTGFVTKPSIVTPLLENGGKAMVCSAGVDYSLVVIKTEERRIGRLSQKDDRPVLHRRGASDSDLSIHNMTRVTSLPSRIEQENEEIEMSSDESLEESLCHHQLYGFGRNDGRKLGLVDPSKRKAADDVLIPRRVALTCKVWPGSDEHEKELPPPGIFAVAASARHSAALVRRASGAIETYTWGDATFDALGPVRDSPTKSSVKRRNRQIDGRFTPSPLAVPVPTVVKQLSHSASSTNGKSIIPVQVALGPTSTFVVTSTGKVLSFGKSSSGLLGQGQDVVMTDKPKQIVFPSAGSRAETKISSISVGPSHAVAIASTGRVYAWGNNEGSVMGFDSTLRKHLSRKARRGATREQSPSQDEVEWIPREVEIPVCTQSVATNGSRRRSSSRDSESSTDMIGPPPLCSSGNKAKDRVLQACAGIDLTVFVKESGEVLSSGASSGRLGLGETGTTSVITPTPMFGGLRL